MTTYSPAEHYDYCTNITATIYGVRDKPVVLFHDFECQVQIETELSDDGFELSARCTDVFVGGESLTNGDMLALRLMRFVRDEVDAALKANVGIWDDVLEREGLSLSGHPGNPDTCWERV